jgi:hypothetical protein
VSGDEGYLEIYRIRLRKKVYELGEELKKN